MSFRARAAERRTSKINQTTIQRYFSRTSFCMTALMSFRARAAERRTSKSKLSLKIPVVIQSTMSFRTPMSFRARAAERRTSKSKLSSKTSMSFRARGAKRGTSKINQITIQRYFGHTSLCMTTSLSFSASRHSKQRISKVQPS